MIITDKLIGLMCIPILAVIIFTIIPTDPTTSTLAVMGINLAVIFYIRKSLHGSMGNIFGNSKSKWECLVCHGNKFDTRGYCIRCGRSMRRPF